MHQENIIKGLKMDSITTSAISALVEATISPILSELKAIGTEAIQKSKVILETSFKGYTERSYERLSKTKTILYNQTPVDIKKFYVRTDLEYNGKVISENNFINEIEQKKRVIVTGSAGLGKSTFCKSIFMECIDSKCGILPIFIELRHVNSKDGATIKSTLVEAISGVNPEFTETQLNYAIKLGKLLLILDGFDEIDSTKRESCEREILELSNNYQKIKILISSRPDNRLYSWEEFHQYNIEPLNKEKALELIDKIDYDKLVKSKFLIELERELYENHNSFASTPLLLTMMLLTYEQIAEIPKKIHLFYEQAFLTLFNKHDTLKSLYKRKSYSNLALDEFKKILSVFCLFSYIEGEYQFSEDSILKTLKKAIDISGIAAKPDDFLNDLLHHVCIIQKDGLGFSFTHRSFQEYFAALYIAGITVTRKYEVIDKFAFANNFDNVMPMLHDMCPDLVEREWIIPRLESLVTEADKVKEGKYHKIELMQILYQTIDAMEGMHLGYTFHTQTDSHSHFLSKLSDIYKNDPIYDSLYEREAYSQEDEDEDDTKNFIREEGLSGRHEQLDITDITKLSIETRERLLKYNVTRFPEMTILYARKKLEELRSKQDQRSADLEAILLS